MSIPSSRTIPLMGTLYVDDKTVQEEQTAEKPIKTIPLSSGTDSKTSAQINKEQLEKVFSELFSQYNYLSTNILADLSKITDKTFSEEILKSYDDIKINNLYKSVKKAFEENYDESTQTLNLDNAIERAKQYHSGGGVEAFNDKSKVQTIGDILKSDKDSGLSNEEKILNYFKNKLAEYNAELNDGNKAKEELIKDFNRILAQTSDADKKLLLPVLLNVLKDENLIKTFFNSFQDKKCRTDCADSVDNEKLSSLDDNLIRTEIIKNMSAKKISEYVELISQEYQEFYNNNREIINTVIHKRQNGIPLDPNTSEVKISEQIDKYLGNYISLQTAIIANDNLTDKEKEDFTNRITQTQRQYPTYQLYLESLAQFVNDNKISLNIGEEKLEQLKNYLDKATDGEYSKAAERVAEKNSAIDPETGLLKQATQDEVTQKRAVVQRLTEQYIVSDSEDEGYTVEVPSQSSHSTPYSSEGNNLASLSADNYSSDLIDEIFSGRLDGISRYIQEKALKDYKNLDLVAQGEVLRTATGMYFNKLLNITDDIAGLLERGWKAKTFALTQKAQEAVDDEKKDDVA